MLPIYNINNSMEISYVQTPDWDLFNIKKRKDKIRFLRQIEASCKDSPILLGNQLSKDNKKPIGIINQVIVDEVGMYLIFKGLLFGSISMNFNTTDDISDENKDINIESISFDSTEILFPTKKIEELLKTNEMLTKLLEEREIENKQKNQQGNQQENIENNIEE